MSAQLPPFATATGAPIRKDHATIEMDVEAEPAHNGTYWREPLLRLRLDTFRNWRTAERDERSAEVRMTSGEARVLARRLEHLADQMDLT